MRICHLIDTWFPVYGGGPKSTLTLIRILADKYDCCTDIITRTLPDENGRAVTRHDLYCGGRVRVYRITPCAPFANIPARLWYLVAAVPYVLKGNYDLIHATAFTPGVPAKIAQFFTGLPIVYTVRGTALEAWKGEVISLRAKLFLLVERWLLLKVRYDYQITVSRNFLNYPTASRKVALIPNGVDAASFDRVNVAKSPQFTILYVGRFDPIKGVDILLEAILQIKRERNSAIQLILVGGGWDEQKLRSYVIAQGLEGTVRFAGFLDGEDLVREYKSSHLFVLPSRSEGQPLTLLEAWAAQLPVIVTRVGANPDMIEDGINGYLVEPKRSDLLAQAIIRAMENPGLPSLGKNGYELIQKKYSWDSVAEQTYRVYQEVLKLPSA